MLVYSSIFLGQHHARTMHTKVSGWNGTDEGFWTCTKSQLDTFRHVVFFFSSLLSLCCLLSLLLRPFSNSSRDNYVFIKCETAHTHTISGRFIYFRPLSLRYFLNYCRMRASLVRLSHYARAHYSFERNLIRRPPAMLKSSFLIARHFLLVLQWWSIIFHTFSFLVFPFSDSKFTICNSNRMGQCDA